MTFLQPAMLWSLAILLPLAAIYFLKVRPRRRPTTAYFLWERIFQERRASSLFQRLRDAWSLLLMLLAAAAVCFALARPEWTDERKDLVLVVDASASMATIDGTKTRLELAKDVARDIVTGLNGTQMGAIATLAGHLTYESHLTDNPRELIDAVDRLAPSAMGLNLAALPTAGKDDSEADEWSREHRIIFISDGAFPPEALPGHVELIKVGTPRENVGLVAADMAYVAGGGSRLGFYFQVVSTFSEPREVDLTLSTLDETGIERLFKVIPLSVERGTNRPETFQLEDAPDGRWLVKLDVADALPTDNLVYLAPQRPTPIGVGVASADPYFLEKSVQAFSQGDALLTLVTDTADGALLADVMLAKEATPEAKNAVIFQPAGESQWWTDLGDEVEIGAARVLTEGHPALRFLDPTSIPFVGAKRLKPPPGAQVLVADDHGLPLIYKARHDGRSAIVVNIDPVAADFYFSAWFPVLVHSAATHLAGREHAVAAGYRPGQAVPIPGGRDDVETTVVALRGTNSSESAKGESPPIAVHGEWFAGADQLGFYCMTNPAGAAEFGINVVDAGESLINNENSTSRYDPLSRGRSPSHWLTLLAIAVLVAESVLYQRRKVG